MEFIWSAFMLIFVIMLAMWVAYCIVNSQKYQEKMCQDYSNCPFNINLCPFCSNPNCSQCPYVQRNNQ